MWNTAALISSTLVTFFAACGGSQPAPAEPAAPAAEEAEVAKESEGMQPAMACPLARPDVALAVDDVDGGAALTVTGSEEQVESLRQWGVRWAAMHHGKLMRKHMAGKGMHGEKSTDGGMMQGKPMDGRDMRAGPSEARRGGMRMMMPPADVSVADAPGGVRLTFKAKRAEDVDKLRQHLSRHAEMMREGTCPMMRSTSPALKEASPKHSDSHGSGAPPQGP